jgi:hypothetical protein
LVPLPVRRHFRDLSAGFSTLRVIAAMWEDHGFVASGDPNDETGQRRGFWREFEDNVDWSDPSLVERVLSVYETLIESLSAEAVVTTRRLVSRHGFTLDDEGRLTVQSGSTIAAAARLPQSLRTLRDPEMILDSFGRIDRAISSDPAQAIGSAKELVEATAKTVLDELSVPFDDKTVKLPWLVDTAQRALGLHPQTVAPGPDGSHATKRILGGLSSIALGLAELRNEGWGNGACGPPARIADTARVPCRRRRAHLVPGHPRHPRRPGRPVALRPRGHGCRPVCRVLTLTDGPRSCRTGRSKATRSAPCPSTNSPSGC